MCHSGKKEKVCEERIVGYDRKTKDNMGTRTMREWKVREGDNGERRRRYSKKWHKRRRQLRHITLHPAANTYHVCDGMLYYLSWCCWLSLVKSESTLE